MAPETDTRAPEFFFIVGCPRSGTTLLRFMLDAHLAIAVLPETHFGQRLAEADADAARPTDPEAWAPLRSRMEELGRARNAAFVGEKTPSHAFHLDTLARAFPRARFLMLTRDPRAVAASWVQTTWSRHSMRGIADTWCRTERAMARQARRTPDRCASVSFERLVEHPARVLHEVCGFLGADFDPQMLRYHERAAGDLSDAERSDHARTFEPPDPDRIAAWRGALEATDLLRIEAICARAMRRRGYAPETSRVARFPEMMRTAPKVWRKRVKHRLRGR